MSYKPHDILPDEMNAKLIEGVEVRKGTVAAALANAEILESSTATEQQKSAAWKILEELAPAIVALKLHKHLTWHNERIQKLILDTAKEKGR